jgi:hypothetical protein
MKWATPSWRSLKNMPTSPLMTESCCQGNGSFRPQGYTGRRSRGYRQVQEKLVGQKCPGGFREHRACGAFEEPLSDRAPLEHGHAKRGGGRVAAKPHIASAEQRGNEKLVQTIEQKLKGG